MHDAVGVHCFAGAFTYGMRRAGLYTELNLESSDFGVDTAIKNVPGLSVSTDPSSWRSAIARYGRRPDVVYGNPACSCWSSLGRSVLYGRESWRSDANLQQTINHIAVGTILYPKIWITESVPQFEKLGAAADIAKYWARRGYSTTLIRHDAKFFGVPQQRRRVILVAHRIPFEVTFPKFEGMVPVGAVLGEVRLRDDDVRFSEDPTIIAHLENVPEGQSILNSIPDDWSGTIPWFGEYRVPYYQPTGTIAGRDGYYHPRENRKLTLREMQLLSGYDDEWSFVCKNPIDGARQLGRTVIPIIGEWIGQNAIIALGNDSPITFDQESKIVTRWSKSPRIKNFDVIDSTELWNLNDADSTWVETNVEQTIDDLWGS